MVFLGLFDRFRTNKVYFNDLTLPESVKLESPESPIAPLLRPGHITKPPLGDVTRSPIPERRRIPTTTTNENVLPIQQSMIMEFSDLSPHSASPMKPSTSRFMASPCADNIPDRPNPVSGNPRKNSHLLATDILDDNCSDHCDQLINGDDVKFRDGDRLKWKKPILVESNYDYTPCRKDELQLKRGSTIRVIRRGDDEDGWWYGETTDGQQGFFPQNHVKLAKQKATEIDGSEIKIEKSLGSGGFSVVYSAIYRGRKVAVKIPHKKFSDKEILDAVREEAGMFQMLSHDNIVEMYGIMVGSQTGLVLELCYDTLAKICSSSKDISLSEEIIGNWGAQIARGMNYLHELNVLHRDLKAANILIKEKVCDCLLNVPSNSSDQIAHRLESRNGFCQKCGGAALNRLTLKITDLGLSKKLIVTDCRMSVTGTIPYLAPEVIRDCICSKAMDVWSFGIVLWEVLTGATPFEGVGIGAVQLQIGTFVKQKIPSSCPADLKQIIENCWRDDPHERPTFKQLVVDLETFADKYKTDDSSDRAFLENSLNTLRKSMMEEMALVLREMAKKADELQKREEELEKGERELKIEKLIFTLQQAFMQEQIKEKPQPPKRKQHLKCSDISEPFDCKTGISLTRDLQMIKSNHGDENSCLNLMPPLAERRPSAENCGVGVVGINYMHSPSSNATTNLNDSMFGFATLPRTPKKLSQKKNSEVNLGSTPNLIPRLNARNVPSTSTPDLLRSYWGSNASGSKDTSPKAASPRLLHRVNAQRIKKDTAKGSFDDGLDGKRIVIENNDTVTDLENLLEQDGRRKPSLDHLATPRRAIPLSDGSRSRDHSRSSSATGEGTRSKGNKDRKEPFLRKIFKQKDKSPAATASTNESLPRPVMMALPLGHSTAGSSIISKSMTPSRLLAKSPSTPKKLLPKKNQERKKSKASTPDKSSEPFTLTENSQTFVKSGERRLSSANAHSTSAINVGCSGGGIRSSNRTPPSIRSSTDDISCGSRCGPYEKLSDASDHSISIIENASYIPSKEFGRQRRISSTTATSSNTNYIPISTSRTPSLSHTLCDDEVPCSSLGIIENLSYRPHSDMKQPKSTSIVTLDSSVEGGIDPGAHLSMNSIDNLEGLSGENLSSVLGSCSRIYPEDTHELYVPLSTIQRSVLNASPRVTTDNAAQTEITSLTNEEYMYSNRGAAPFELPSTTPYIPLDGRSAAAAAAGTEYSTDVYALSSGRPQRPYTLDLHAPSTPAESGISTAGSSYRSLPSADQAPQDHAPPPPTEMAPRPAPPIPPRINARRHDDDSASRSKLSPVSQSP